MLETDTDSIKRNEVGKFIPGVLAPPSLEFKPPSFRLLNLSLSIPNKCLSSGKGLPDGVGALRKIIVTF